MNSTIQNAAMSDRSGDGAHTELPRGASIICFSHLRWNFVYQLPQHLMTRFARHNTVWFIEVPIADDHDLPRLEVRAAAPNVNVVVPRLPSSECQRGHVGEELPGYLGRWDVATMPFAINAATHFISPTKTPQYLAGGCPVVSTPVPDVVRAYGHTRLVRFGRNADEFVAAIEAALATPARSPAICDEADAILRGESWDNTQRRMAALMAERLREVEGSATRRASRPQASYRALAGSS